MCGREHKDMYLCVSDFSTYTWETIKLRSTAVSIGHVYSYIGAIAKMYDKQTLKSNSYTQYV